MKDINEKSTTMNKLLLGLIFTILLCASCTNRGMVAIDNGIVKLEFDLKQESGWTMWKQDRPVFTMPLGA